MLHDCIMLMVIMKQQKKIFCITFTSSYFTVGRHTDWRDVSSLVVSADRIWWFTPLRPEISSLCESVCFSSRREKIHVPGLHVSANSILLVFINFKKVSQNETHSSYSKTQPSPECLSLVPVSSFTTKWSIMSSISTPDLSPSEGKKLENRFLSICKHALILLTSSFRVICHTQRVRSITNEQPDSF